MLRTSNLSSAPQAEAGSGLRHCRRVALNSALPSPMDEKILAADPAHRATVDIMPVERRIYSLAKYLNRVRNDAALEYRRAVHYRIDLRINFPLWSADWV